MEAWLITRNWEEARIANAIWASTRVGDTGVEPVTSSV